MVFHPQPVVATDSASHPEHSLSSRPLVVVPTTRCRPDHSLSSRPLFVISTGGRDLTTHHPVHSSRARQQDSSPAGESFPFEISPFGRNDRLLRVALTDCHAWSSGYTTIFSGLPNLPCSRNALICGLKSGEMAST
jgi:hypothetical protein